MEFHEIIAKGPIYIHKVATKPVWAINDLSRIIYTLDNNQVCIAGGAGVADWMTICDLESVQTISGVKTFSTLPLLDADPSDDDHPVRKSYLESYTESGYVDMSSDQLTIDGIKGFLHNPLVSGAPGTDLEVANKGYVDDNFVDITNNQTLSGIKTFTDIPVGPNLNPSSDNQLVRKRYVDDQITAVGDNQTKITSLDGYSGYLSDKLVAGSGVTLSTIGASGTDQTLRISLSPSTTGAGDGELFVSGSDTTPGYLGAKLVAGEGISLTIGSPSGDEYVEVSYSGGNDRYVTYDFTDSVGAAEAGYTLTMPAPNASNAITISKNSSNTICHSAYEHPGSWTVTPTEDLVVKVKWTPIFPYGYYRSGWNFYYPTLQYLSQTLTWKYYRDCTSYNSGSPNGSLLDWDFFPLYADFIYVPYDDSAQTHVNGVWTPGFNMALNSYYYQKSFGCNYDDDPSFYMTHSTNSEWVSYVTQPLWCLGCSPAPDIDTDIQKYYFLKEKGLKFSSQQLNYNNMFLYDDQDPYYNGSYNEWASWDYSNAGRLVDGDVRYVVLKSGTSYTLKLRSFFGRRYMGPYGYGSASAMWYSGTYNIGNGYAPTAAGDYTLSDIWSMYQGAGTTHFRLKTIAKNSLNLPF